MEDLETKEQEQEQETPEQISMTKDELDKLLQSEADKRVQSALEKSKQRIREEVEKDLQNEKGESERLASLTETEKIKEELQKERAELEELKKQVNFANMVKETEKQMKEKNLPGTFANLMIADTAEQTAENITKFAEDFKTAVEDAVKTHLGAGHVPKQGESRTHAVTLEDFKKMGYAQRVQLAEKNPTLYKKLANQ